MKRKAYFNIAAFILVIFGATSGFGGAYIMGYESIKDWRMEPTQEFPHGCYLVDNSRIFYLDSVCYFKSTITLGGHIDSLFKKTRGPKMPRYFISAPMMPF